MVGFVGQQSPLLTGGATPISPNQQGSRLGRLLLAKSLETRPVLNPLQGVGQLAQAGLGAFLTKQGMDQDATQAAARQQAIQQAFGGGGTQMAGPGGGPGSAAPAGGGDSRLAALLNSGDPQLQNIAMQRMLQAPPKAPDIKQIRQGNDFVTFEIDPRTGERREIGRSPIAASKPVTNVVTNVAGEKAQTKFQEGLARTANKIIDETQTAAGAATEVNESLDLFEQALGSAQGGGLAETKIGIGRAFQALGLDPQEFGIDDVGSLEAANALSNRLALKQVEQMKGALSDRELAFIRTQIPSITQTPEGRQKLIGLMRVAAGKAQNRADFVTDWIAENPGTTGANFMGALRKYDKENALSKKDLTPQVPEGAQIVNDETGEIRVRRGGKWINPSAVASQ